MFCSLSVIQWQDIAYNVPGTIAVLHVYFTAIASHLTNVNMHIQKQLNIFKPGFNQGN